MTNDFLTVNASALLNTIHGPFVIDTFVVNGNEAIVLRTADIPGGNESVTCRIQSECISHLFGDMACDCDEQIATSLRQIQAKSGLLVYLRQEGMELGIAGKLAKDARDWRTYSLAAEILRYYGITSVDLITVSKSKIQALRSAGIEVHNHYWYDGSIVRLGNQISRTVEQVRAGTAHRPVATVGKPRVLIVGDLNIDRIQIIREPAVGGTAYHAALALKSTGEFVPVVFGKVGRDHHGTIIIGALRTAAIASLVGEHGSKATGLVDVIPTGDSSLPFQCLWEKLNNANDYDEDNLDQALELAGINSEDYVFVASYLFVQKCFDPDQINAVLRRIAASGGRIILDITRKSVANDVLRDCGIAHLDKSVIQSFIAGVQLHAVIGEISTFDYLGLIRGKRVPDAEVFQTLSAYFSASWVVCRFVEAGDVYQRIAGCSGGRSFILSDESTGSPVLAPDIHIGFPEEMFARALSAMHRYEHLNISAK